MITFYKLVSLFLYNVQSNIKIYRLTHSSFFLKADVVDSNDSPILDGVLEHAEESDTVVAVEWTDWSSSSITPSSSMKSSVSLGTRMSSRSS